MLRSYTIIKDDIVDDLNDAYREYKLQCRIKAPGLFGIARTYEIKPLIDKLGKEGNEADLLELVNKVLAIWNGSRLKNNLIEVLFKKFKLQLPANINPFFDSPIGIGKMALSPTKPMVQTNKMRKEDSEIVSRYKASMLQELVEKDNLKIFLSDRCPTTKFENLSARFLHSDLENRVKEYHSIDAEIDRMHHKIYVETDNENDGVESDETIDKFRRKSI